MPPHIAYMINKIIYFTLSVFILNQFESKTKVIIANN